MTSLRGRAVIGGILWAAVTITLGFAGLQSFIDQGAERRFDELLLARLTQVVTAVENVAATPEAIQASVGDPAFARPMSGLYWQVENEFGQVYRSASLGQDTMPRPQMLTSEIVIDGFSGPMGEPVRGMSQTLTLADGSIWHVHVATSLRSLRQELAQLREIMLVAFTFVVVIGVVGALLQVSVTLRPIEKLRRDVQRRWISEGGLDHGKYPEEVAPLVYDIDTLLNRNREIVQQSRKQAADLGHAIKTPAAIIRNELETLARQGQPVSDAIAALDRLDAQLKRAFGRMRAQTGTSALPSATEMDRSLGRMVRAFSDMAQQRGLVLTSDYPPGLRLRMDPTDLEEVLGNLLDNAQKWAVSAIRLTATTDAGDVTILIEDDGPGIPPDQIALAMSSGQRLDNAKPGTGLGLSIAADLLQAYGSALMLDKSAELGGLRARFRLPVAPAQG
ncbi:sensor histidine kinase [Yoonia vestfoldensis]|uniref:sensor histidine kinase n=1 Tax=Yoonia vestfoldensis TaxID=245188 RepID=UPI000360B76F|nr:HAMP domain-containing sensor histidine kinase [Yoonia vestfoldensis]